jgi:parvulin-like peptidyl-prolyl isomerase
VKLRAWALPALALVLAACGSSGGGQPAAAAVVNGHQISMEAYTAEFHQQRAAAIGSYGYDVCSIKQMTSLCNALKQKALNSVIDGELVREYAAKHGITVTPAEDSVRWKQVFLNRFDNRKDVESAWLRNEAISEADLRRSLHQDLLEQKVIYAVTAGLSPYQPSVRIAQITSTSQSEEKQIQGYLKRGVPFLQAAAVARGSKLPGCSVGPCGDLGWTADALVPADGRRLLTAPVGTVIGPLRGQTEVLFFQVEARSPHYKLNNRVLYSLRQLKFTAWVEQQQKLAKVTKHVAV